MWFPFLLKVVSFSFMWTVKLYMSLSYILVYILKVELLPSHLSWQRIRCSIWMCFWKTDLSVYISGVGIVALRTHGMWEAHDFTFDLILLHCPFWPSRANSLYGNAGGNTEHMTQMITDPTTHGKFKSFVLNTMMYRITIYCATVCTNIFSGKT